MKVSLVLLIVVIHLNQMFALSGCKKSIENGIKKFWKEHGTPKFRDAGLMRFAYATKDISPDNVKCVLATHDYGKKLAPATFYYTDGKKKSVEFKITTGEGLIHQTLGNQEFLEYIILDQNDVIAFYKCIPNAPATGPDSAIVAVSVTADGKQASNAEIGTSLVQLTSLGISDLRPVGSCPENVKKG